METLQRTANRGSISTGFDIDNSVKLEPDNSEYFQRPASGSNGSLTTWTFSLWLKRTELSHNNIFYSQGGYGRVRFETDDTLTFFFNSGHELSTTRKFRDTSAWYHIVLAVDTTDGTAANRLKVYVNGVQETMSGTQPSQNEEGDFGKFASVTAQLGQFVEGSYYFAGYMAEFYWIDGIQQAPTEFGEFDSDTGIWKPIEYTGSFGSEGVYLDFEDAANLGDDVSGNGNNFTPINITAADQATDTPTNNFCTWNPLQTGWNTNYGTGQVIVEGATEAYASTNYAAIEGSMAVQSGKWYWESKPNRTGGIMVGVAALNGIRWAGDTAYWYLGMNAQGIGTILGNFYYNGSVVSTDATDWTNGDIVSIALDMDNYKIYMAVNGSWGGTSNPATGTGGYDFSSASNFTSNFVVPAGRIETANSSYVIETNFGGYTTMSIASGNSDSSGYGNFEYAPPSGYYALCTKNLAEYG